MEYARGDAENKQKKQRQKVLILVLVEYARGEITANDIAKLRVVLILVLVEYALREKKTFRIVRK